MKSLINFTSTALVLVIALFFTACRKDNIATEPRPFYDEAYGSFHYEKLHTSSMEPGTWEDWYAIKATGTAINMTNTKSLASFYVKMGAGKIEGLGTPVNKAHQAELAGTRYSKLPREVNHIIFDDKGNSLWLHFEHISMSTAGCTVYVFDGNSTVVGGTGLYAHATGTIYLSGQIDFVDPAGSMLRNEGTVSY